MGKCLKVCYWTRKAAKAEMKALNKNHLTSKEIKNVYFCDECSSWHLTSMSKKRSRHFTKNINNGKNKTRPQ